MCCQRWNSGHWSASPLNTRFSEYLLEQRRGLYYHCLRCFVVLCRTNRDILICILPCHHLFLTRTMSDGDGRPRGCSGSDLQCWKPSSWTVQIWKCTRVEKGWITNSRGNWSTKEITPKCTRIEFTLSNWQCRDDRYQSTVWHAII